MTDAITRTTLRQTHLKTRPFLGFAATADSVTATAIVDVSEFGSLAFDAYHFEGRYLYRYALTDPDRVKLAATVAPSTGTLSISDATNYVNTASLTYENLALHPDEYNDAIIRAQRRQASRSLTPLVDGRATDLDMETAGVAYWDGTSGGSVAPVNGALSKTTTAGDVYSGTQSLKLTASGVNAVYVGQKIRTQPYASITAPIRARADVGTLTLRLYDATNGAYFSTFQTITYLGKNFAVLGYLVIAQAPSGCKEFQIVFGQAGATDIAIIDTCFGPYQGRMMTYQLPAWMDDRYKIKWLRPIEFEAMAGVANFCWDADSEAPTGDLQQDVDYYTTDFHRESVRYRVHFLPDSLGEAWTRRPTPLYVVAERMLTDTETLTTEASTTTAPLNELLAYIDVEIYELLVVSKRQERYRPALVEANAKIKVEELIRPSLKKVAQRGVRNYVV